MKEKIKKWAELIESERLEPVLEDIQANICMQLDDKLNKYMFKLLLYLSHTADKCKQNKQNYTTGKRIAKLAKLLCSLLINIPEDKTYVVSLYHIIRCLISFDLYEDAADICCYLQAESLHSNAADLLIKILFLWRTPINNLYHTLTTESSNTKSYNNLKSIIGYEIKMIRITYKNYTKHLITRMSMHLDQMRMIDNGTNTYFNDFSKHILKHLAEMQLHLDEDEKYVIYYHAVSIICRTLCRSINRSQIENATNTLDELSSYFEDLMVENEECRQCFQQFRNLCTTLLVPVVNFTSDNAKNLQNFVACSLESVQKYGYTGAAKWNALSIAEIVEPMLIYWETHIKNDKQQFFDTNVLLETMNLIVHMSTFFVNGTSSKCKSCVNRECTVKKDIYNAVVLKCRCINFTNKFPIKTLPKEVCILARKMLEQNVTLIHEMRECRCKRWKQLWSTCGTLIYNLGIVSEYIYEESACLFSLLCTCIFRFQEIGSDCKYLPLENPISSALHRLSTVHYANDMYREAMTVCALNALLTYNQPNTKAFHMWVNIKKKCAKKFAKLTMLNCLKDDKNKISEMGLSVDISTYDLIQLCSREAESLLEEKIPFADGVSAVLDELRKLKPPNDRYTHTIQLLGHYLLDCEYDSSVLQYQKQAISDLKQDKSNSIAVLCLEANLKFFIFVDELCTMNKVTHTEMDTTRFALCAAKLPEHRETKSPNVVPGYTMLNIKKDSSLMLSLQKSLRKWDQLFKCDINEIIKNWEPNLILSILVTAGEYSRLYRYEECEIEAWILAYKLASKINDYSTIIYVTGRSISLRQIDYNWIATAQKYAIEHKNSKDGGIIRSIAIFWMNLADFYFECGKYEDAKKLLTDARNLPGVSFLSNTSIYLLSLDIIIRNCVYKNNVQHEDYSSYIVESLYAMVNLSEDLSTKKWKNQTEYLFNYDVLFTTTVNLSVRVNSLLSFREISAHLVRRVKAAQSLGAVTRIAEMLKSLCYIDLSRSKLDDCEVKLQGLEHMLDIETFELSMNAKPVETPAHLTVTPTKIVDPVRDVSQHGTSPVLGTKMFDLPKFALHTNCNCYKCSNISYRYLVFTSTYIRAQLYALQNQVAVALDHFHGAFKIRQKLFDEKMSVLPENCATNKASVKRFSWQARSYITDYVYLLIDFCYFLKINVTSRQQDAFDIANLAINVCHKYQLEGHPVYMSAKELALDNNSQLILESSDCSEFMVPQPDDIDISKYTEIPAEQNICVTPSVQNQHAKKLLSVRRKRNPMTLNLDTIMIFSDDEDNGTSSPPAYSARKPKLRKNLIRRKLLEDDLTDNVKSNKEDATNKEDVTPIEIKLMNRRTRDKNNTHIKKRSIKDNTVKVTSLTSDMSENLDLPSKSDATTESMDKLIEKMGNFKIDTDTLRRKRDGDTKQLTTNCNESVDQTIELLEGTAISENASIDSLVLMGEVNKLSIQDQKNSEIHDKKGLIKTSKISKQSAENENTTSISEVKTVRDKRNTKPLISEVHGVRTRSNVKKLKEKKPS